MSEVVCPVCGASQWARADCFGCGHPLDANEEAGSAPAVLLSVHE